LRARGKGPRSRGATKQDELAPPQSIELHPMPHGPGQPCQVIALAGISQRENEPLHNPPRSSESASGHLLLRGWRFCPSASHDSNGSKADAISARPSSGSSSGRGRATNARVRGLPS
jgi:hypothetical protein